ncbi:unnamed protein product [Prorocentrum cordatum]|uniref:Sulfotransferase n=1 Tax=Prorocentrum cordatum TaxID=2364126 RepID=A0ABN9T4T0_9DINO|nr:unnamed protein product [Polarella glacialis]|mmetsp:Transcript_55612/g.144574  ORF Transcript_55612/g.144574 Transcript_55612/m.144574 type:complete len:297 (-) Transcript_55612:80-970(-)
MVVTRAIVCVIFTAIATDLASGLSFVSQPELDDVALEEFYIKADSHRECADIERGGPDWYDEDSHVEDWRHLVSVCHQNRENMTWRANSSRVQFVHVGKCGGSSIGQAIRELVPYDEIHLRKVQNCEVTEQRKWVVSVRDPVDRAISAFNWGFPGDTLPMMAIYKCFKTVNEFAEALQDESWCGVSARRAINKPILSEHLGKGFQYYFDEDLECVLAQELYLIRTETLMQDLTDVFGRLGWKLPATVYHIHGEYPFRNETYLSAKGKQLLANALKADYEVLRRLEGAARNGRPGAY